MSSVGFAVNFFFCSFCWCRRWRRICSSVSNVKTWAFFLFYLLAFARAHFICIPGRAIPLQTTRTRMWGKGIPTKNSRRYVKMTKKANYITLNKNFFFYIIYASNSKFKKCNKFKVLDDWSRFHFKHWTLAIVARNWVILKPKWFFSINVFVGKCLSC